MTSGFIYVLINPSMPNLVKVGRTTRDPETRVSELSKHTGVPTPFLLAYDAYFEDCVSAERYIHELLEARNFRLSRNREFFNAPLSAVIKTTVYAQNLAASQNPTTENQNQPHTTRTSAWKSVDNELTTELRWEDVLKEADNHFYGLGEVLKDEKKALKLYKQAAQLGAVAAYHRIGTIYKNSGSNNKNTDLALEYFNEGASRGDGRCWGEMAILYYLQPSNAKKCWKKYFESEEFYKNEFNDGFYHKLYYSFEYMFSLERNYQSIVYEAELFPIKNELLRYAQTIFDDVEKSEYKGSELYWAYWRALRRIEKLKLN